MITNKAIPFRPKLEGEFRTRFYTAVQTVTEETRTTDLERIASEEVYWAEHICPVNLVQRKKYRAVWMLLRDLIRASWKACYREGVLEMRLPSLDSADLDGNSIPEMKSLLRSWMQDSRLERLQLYSDFINRMERETSTKRSVACLIADGEELHSRLKRVVSGESKISDSVCPYLQLVKENERDEFSGQKLSEIWRYFRLSWSTPAETTPGRTMQYLIRDAAHPMHAVMGIASLENTAVQITCRDDYIGWNAPSYIERLKEAGSSIKTKEAFATLLGYLEDGILGIDYDDLCMAREIEAPTEDVVKKLQYIAVTAEEERQDLLKAYQGGRLNRLLRKKANSEAFQRKLSRHSIKESVLINLVNCWVQRRPSEICFPVKSSMSFGCPSAIATTENL